MTTILWHPIHQTSEGNQRQTIKGEDESDLEHPLALDGYYISPKPYIEYTKENHKDFAYYNDPSWRHYWENTFVVFNQKDISFKYDTSTGKIYDTSFDLEKSQDYLYVQEGIASMDISAFPYKGFLVIQYNESMMFWPEIPNKNLWIEAIPYPDMYHKTGMELIGAEFPLGRWLRSVNGAYSCHKPEINLTRGDPMYMVRFRGARDAKYNLQRCKGVVPPSDIRQKFRVSQALKTWLPQQSWTIIKDDVEEKKCPFNFLFK